MKKYNRVLYAIIIIVLLSIVERYLTYWPKSLIKIILMALIPIYLFKAKPKLNKLKISKESLIIIILILTVFPVVFHMFKDLINLEQIKKQLEITMGITKNNFLLVAIYISIINSAIEEYFFRSYLLFDKHLRNSGLISAALFSIYHLAIMGTWTHPLVICISLISLFIVGLIFNFLTQKYESFFNSWVVHMTANIMINLITYTFIL